MNVFASGFVAATAQPWSELFFVAWYATGVLLLLNIITSVFLAEFLSTIESTLHAANVGRKSDSISTLSGLAVPKADDVASNNILISPQKAKVKSPRPLARPVLEKYRFSLASNVSARNTNNHIASNLALSLDDLKLARGSIAPSFLTRCHTTMSHPMPTQLKGASLLVQRVPSSGHRLLHPHSSCLQLPTPTHWTLGVTSP